MGTSTIARAKPRLLMTGFPARTPHNRYRGIAGPDSRAQRICSPAGLHRRPWLARLRRALALDLFVLHFQPIVSLADGHVAHHEALVRLQDDPDGHLVGPASFLPAAERYGLIREIDRMVLDKVAAMLGSQDGRRHGCIAMNLSALSLTDEHMLAHIQRGLDRHDADPARLILEITETASISDMPRARAFCADAQRLGCAVALDDFGAGFGSFHYLKHLPFSYLKTNLSSRRSSASFARWASARSPSSSATSRRCVCCVSSASTTRRGFSWGAHRRCSRSDRRAGSWP
jgi:EAL domain-containing protein (putative c-di-GMP-specific phosphodiesterase class I)